MPHLRPRIVGIANGPPFNPATWSGSSLGLFSALQRLGILEDAVSAEPSRMEKRLAKALAFSPSRERWRGRFHAGAPLARAASRAAERALGRLSPSYNVILQLAPYVADGADIMASYHDDDLVLAIGRDSRMRGITRADVRARLNRERPIYQAMDRVFTMSTWAADAIAEEYGLSRDRVRAVGAGSNIPEELLAGERNYDQPHLLFVGRDFMRKGGPTVLAAFRELRGRIPSARLTIVGLPHSGILQDGVESVGLVRLSGDAGKRRMAELFCSASMFVMPSEYEPFGIALVEAMAAGLPCIGSDRCAMPEIIGDAGETVPFGNAHRLALAMYEVAGDARWCAELGQRARRRYQMMYGWDRVAFRIAAAVANVYAERGGCAQSPVGQRIGSQ